MTDFKSNASVMISQNIPADRDCEYCQWHEKFTDIALHCEGLIEASLFEPIMGTQEEWVQLFQFEAVEQLNSFLNKGEFRSTLTACEKEFGKKIRQQAIVNTKQMTVPVTIVVFQRVKPDHMRDYKKWLETIGGAAAERPGFIGRELIKPIKGLQDDWVIIIRFDSEDNLNLWLSSSIHKKLMKESESFLERVQYQKIGRGFEDWLAHARGVKSNTLPPQWKMAMLIILALYPIIMLISIWILPLMEGWVSALSVFVSSIISVSVLTWVAMPIVTRVFGFWLSGGVQAKKSVTFLGATTVIFLYMLTILIFVLL
ncbi:antibiotic biosynthesis monooxygenase [Microbulbifer sp. GL-2]|uniref:antibiotic biosynthesis monooxygenase n=1 Tax=Microbulbifer sp. GL-2 TaxID=2591606 RepID=UPI001162B7CA|nr:antibiotic biosynthesis monooxygenase [Microbulbifer sp. GL-2]BBM03132.1 hypothetical protein GL2_32060 [Microbulbifer sp. GL-2]